MSKFHSPDNYWGNMRVDGDVAKKPTYVSIFPPRLSLESHADKQFPNSYSSTNPASAAPGFIGESVAEAPYQAASNVVSRRSHWSHEGEVSEYDQVRELYTRVMTPEQRDHLHNNTAKLLAVCSLSIHF
jgi:catalase